MIYFRNKVNALRYVGLHLGRAYLAEDQLAAINDGFALLELEPPHVGSGRYRAFERVWILPGRELVYHPGNPGYLQDAGLIPEYGGQIRYFPPAPEHFNSSVSFREGVNELLWHSFEINPFTEEELGRYPVEVGIHYMGYPAPCTATPNRPHRDDERYNVIVNINSEGIIGGINTFHTPEGDEIARCQLTEPLQTLGFLNDPYLHHVTDMTPAFVGARRNVIIFDFSLCYPER